MTARPDEIVAPASGGPVPPQAAPTRRWPLWGALVLLLVVGVAAALPLRTPSPRPASAAEDAFSAERALGHLDDIATNARPTGSQAQARVREYLVAELRELDLRPRQLSGVAQAPAEPATVGAVTNVYARIPGSAPTGAVLVVAHYDSVPTGPGAADNGANVAAVLELARALRAGAAPRNDVVILLTDGEESGSLGAKAFADSGVLGDPSRVAVVNLEARGGSGPAIMFETAGTGLGSAIHAAGAVATSLSDEVYRALPNGTDLTVFGEAGMRGLNFAFVGGADRYHTSHDDITSVDPGSVQDIGDAALAATRDLAATDLRRSGPATTYFGVFGALVSYPEGLVLPLAGLALLGFVALLWLGRRRGLSPQLVGRCAATFPLVLLAPVLIGLAGSWGLGFADPDSALTYGFTSALPWYAAAEVALVAVGVIAWYRWVRRRAGTADVMAAVLGWLVLFGLLLAVVAPSAAYLVTWPALGGLLVAGVALGLNRFSASVAALAALPAVVLLVPVCVLFVPVLGLNLLAAMLVLAALLGATVAALAELLPRRRATTTALLAGSLVAVLLFVGTAVLDRPSAAHPRPVSLGYLLDADTGSAFWVSEGTAAQPVVGAKLTEPPRRFDDRLPFLGPAPVSSGPAPVAAATGPSANTPTVTEVDGVRTVRVRLSAPEGTDQLAVNVDTRGHQVVAASVAGVSLPVVENWPAAEGGWRWGFLFVGPPSRGVDVELRVRGDAEVPVRAVAVSAGLPDVPQAPELPERLHFGRWPSVAGQSFVARTFHF